MQQPGKKPWSDPNIFDNGYQGARVPQRFLYGLEEGKRSWNWRWQQEPRLQPAHREDDRW